MHPLPCGVDVDLEQDDERVELREELPGLDGTCPDGDDGRLPTVAGLSEEARLDLPEGRLALLGEELPDRAMSALDLAVDIQERPAETLRHLRADRRLASAHEADEDEVAVDSVQCGRPIRSR